MRDFLFAQTSFVNLEKLVFWVVFIRFYSVCVNQSVNQKTLCELFNHSSVSITKRYLGLRQEEILQTYDCLSF